MFRRLEKALCGGFTKVAFGSPAVLERGFAQRPMAIPAIDAAEGETITPQ